MDDNQNVSTVSRRVAIWGNMNNVGFALLRYLRDFGVNAHLFPYSNDGEGPLSHFRPDADTWQIDRWSEFIHTLPFPDAQVSALDAPFSWALAAKSWIGNIYDKDLHVLSTVSRQSLRRLTPEDDVIIGAGIAPAVLDRIGRSIDLFYPYATRIEYIASYDFGPHGPTRSFMGRLVNAQVQRRQISGIQNAGTIISFEQEQTSEVLRSIGRTSLSLAFPMVYVERETPVKPPTPVLARALQMIGEADISVLHHARLLWRKPEHVSAEDWKIEGKNSHWLFHAIAGLCSRRPSVKPLLLVAEYGPDVEATRRLAEELGISHLIIWLPLMLRKEIMWLLDKVDVGVGEFYDCHGMIWGGTGWEVMAAGRPLVQGFNFEEGEFAATFGYEEPPFLKVRTKEDVLRHLTCVLDASSYGKKVGLDCRKWFNTHNGSALARKWLAALPPV